MVTEVIEYFSQQPKSFLTAPEQTLVIGVGWVGLSKWDQTWIY